MNNLLKPFVPPQRAEFNDLTDKRRPMSSIKSNKAPMNGSQKVKIKTTGSFSTNSVSQMTNELCYILYRKKSTKKNKTWGLDAYGVISSKKEVAYNYEMHQRLFVKVYNSESGNFIAGLSIIDDSEQHIATYGNFEFQFSHYLSSKEEIDQAYELIKIKKVTSNADIIKKRDASQENMHINDSDISVDQSYINNDNIEEFDDDIKVIKKVKLVASDLTRKFVIPVKSQNKDQIEQYNMAKPLPGKPLFDKNNIKNPLIMNKENAYTDVDVIVDPSLSQILREHQRIGVQFMYDCIMNVKSKDITGCLLADEMGLGKTLMTITLIWTLLKQSPKQKLYSPLNECGVIKKVIIVCPVSLINNWKLEFKKWLGIKVGVKILNTKTGNNSAEIDKQEFQNFLNVHKVFQVVIISYEKVLSLKNIFENTDFRDKADLLVCDEAHKLKNNNSKILQILKNVDFKKKILLTGTPIQNDLQEFYTICDFLNPGYFGNLNQFKKNYIVPISKARNTESRFNKDLVELGEEKSNALIEETSKFILRRTNEILNKFLPPKRDYIIFCKPTKHQVAVTESILATLNIGSELSLAASSLGLITLLKKICNTPKLLESDTFYKNNIESNNIGISKVKSDYSSESGKIKVLDNLLAQITSTTNDKIVIISNYTQTLDIIQDLLKYKHHLPFIRLDGSTPAKLRPSIVKDFNTNSHIKCFLLSAKSGGMGLNLIGGNRLILFDNDWNPAIDQQAMGRVHRDGQKKECFIYRLVSTGMIDEKILQRQVTKINLSKKILNDDTDFEKEGSKQATNNSDIFDVEDLKDLFTIKKNTRSNTHDLICDCIGDGKLQPVNDTQDYDIDIDIDISNKFIEGSKVVDVLNKFEERDKNEKRKFMKQCFKGYSHFDLSFTTEHKMIDSILNNIDRTDISFVLEK
ncbi:hypothetical protein QEN19_001038 [Hanseniaspora menglaensis]